MSTAKKMFFLVCVTLLGGCGGAKEDRHCKGTKEACLKDRNCLCWCSQKCGYRKKDASDRPVYVEKDSNGKFCYCKQWDLDHYEDNCISGKKVKEPK